MILRIKNELYDWRTGAAIILSNLVYGKNLSTKTNDFQNKLESYAQKETKDMESFEELKNNNNENVEEDEEENANKSDKNDDALAEKRLIKDFSDNEFNSLPSFPTATKVKKSMSENPGTTMYLRKLDHENLYEHNQHRHNHPDLSEGEIEDDELAQPQIPKINDIEIPLDRGVSTMTDLNYRRRAKKAQKKKTKYRKTLFLTSDQLKKLNLKYGRNEITYTVDSGFQGLQTNSSRIFFWNHKVKIVVTDVDGTITKSDVLGHILPRFGKDWSHGGVTELYTNIKNNGYEFLYLTSRAIGMADSTRAYLQTLQQDANYRLPDGPCIMSPDRLMISFKREVIDRKPQLFKIAALLNIKNLFKEDQCPFYAGFGNRDTDAISYRAVGINIRRIFIINPKSEVVVFRSMYKKSYPLMNELVDQMFPPVCSKNYIVSKHLCVLLIDSHFFYFVLSKSTKLNHRRESKGRGGMHIGIPILRSQLLEYEDSDRRRH